VKNCPVENIRNFVLVGHAGAGKTSLADLMLFKAGAVTRLGSVDQKSSVSDFRPEEQERKCSLYSAVLNLPWKSHHFFFTDTPGSADFCGETIAAQRVADMALLIIDATLGIGPGTLRAWKMAKELEQPRAIFINGMDREQADFEQRLAEIQESYGATTCLPFTVPVGTRAALSAVWSVLKGDAPAGVAGNPAKYREPLIDTVAEADEALMARYLDGAELSEAEISAGLRKAIHEGRIVPVFCGSVAKDIGVAELMDGIVSLFPNPLEGRNVPLLEGELERRAEGEPGLALVFKSVADPFIGQLSFLRIYAGRLSSDTDYLNVTQNAKERVGPLLLVNGKEQTTTTDAGPGEIVAIAKLKATHINNTLATKPAAPQFKAIEFPKPTISYAVFAVKKGEEEKIANGVHRMAEEDPTIKLERNAETHEILLCGMGDQHVNNVVHRLRNTFKVEVELKTPKVPYRETITGIGTHVYRHKKQTGGHGQFAEVHLRLEPNRESDYEFVNDVVGGNIPRNFIPAVEKGVLEAKTNGPLAGCLVINFRAAVYDGKYHPVDSSEMAFKIAARGAFRGAMANAHAILLEPIMKLKIMFPEAYMGDITGDLNSRRGRILGMGREEGIQVVFAEVPMAETFTYSSTLRSITQGRGAFEMAFDRYEPVPSVFSKQIQEAAAKARVAEAEE